MYSQPQIDIDHQVDSFLSSLDLPCVSQEQNKGILAEIKMEDLQAAITRLKSETSALIIRGTTLRRINWHQHC